MVQLVHTFQSDYVPDCWETRPNICNFATVRIAKGGPSAEGFLEAKSWLFLLCVQIFSPWKNPPPIMRLQFILARKQEQPAIAKNFSPKAGQRNLPILPTLSQILLILVPTIFCNIVTKKSRKLTMSRTYTVLEY